jgi:hypothetical protein
MARRSAVWLGAPTSACTLPGVKRMLLLARMAACTGCASAALGQAQPVCLVGVGATVYRVTGGSVETFAGQPGEIVGMTVVPPGVSVIGCQAGDAIAVENADGGRIWRVDHAQAGTPQLVEIGHLPAGVGFTDLAFAHGRMFAIGWGADFAELDPATFQQLGATIPLQPTTAGIGGLTFDGSSWYATNGNTDRLVRIGDPPTQASWTAVGSVGLNFDNSDLEWFGGQLWGALRSPPDASGRLLIGTFDPQSGQFTTVWDAASVDQSLPIGMAALQGICYANCDGSTTTPVLNIADLVCFQGRFASGDAYANCDGSTAPPVLNVNDYVCFLERFAAGCP